MLLFFHLLCARDSNKALETVFHEASSRGHRKYKFQNHLTAEIFEKLTIEDAKVDLPEKWRALIWQSSFFFVFHF